MASINCSVIFIISCLRAENRKKRKRLKTVRHHEEAEHVPLLMLSLNIHETSDI